MLKRLIHYSEMSRFWKNRLHHGLASRFLGKDHFRQEMQKENAVLVDAASRLGIAVNDHGGGMLEFRHQERSFFLRANVTELESAISHKIAGDKYLTAMLLQREGLPVPPFLLFNRKSFHEAEAHGRSAGYALVVKPRRGTSSGSGVTAGITRPGDLRRALYRASFLDSDVMVEQFIEGEHIRLLMLGDKLLSAVRRVPAAVTGDGRRSIARLIRDINRHRKASSQFPRLWPILRNDDMRLTLRRQNLGLKHVPSAGETIAVKTICNGHQGGTVEEVTTRTHADFITMAARALEICKVTLGGIDLITPDVSCPADGRSFINEINTTPSFYGHYQAGNREDLQDPAKGFLQEVFNIRDSITETGL